VKVRRWAILIALAAVLSGSALALAQDQPADEPGAAAKPAIPPPAAVVRRTPAEQAPVDELGEALEQFYGKTIGRISFDIPFYLDRGPIERASKLHEGRLLVRWRVRQTLRNLFLVGEVENAAILCSPAAEDKVDVAVKIYPRYIIRDIRVTGSTAYSASEITDDILHIEAGDDFHDEDIAAFRKKLTEAFARVGRLKAETRIEAVKTKRNEDNKVDLFIHVKEGPQFHIEHFDFSEAELGVYKYDEVLRVAKWKRDAPFAEKKLQDGVARIRSWLEEDGHREARVPDLDVRDAASFRIDLDRAMVTVLFPLKVGPRVDVYYDNDCFTCAEKKWKFREALGLDNQKRFNDWIAQDFAKRLRLYFQRQGYYAAVVNETYREYVEPGGLPVKEIRLTGDKGPKVKVEPIDFRENRSFDDKILRKLLTNPDVYVEEDFDKDLENVVNYYNQHGFLQARIVEKSVTYDEAAHRISVVVTVSEGPQTIVRSLQVEGAKAASAHDLLKALAALEEDERLEVGKPFNPFLVTKAKTVLLSEYFKRGYAKARIRDKADFTDDNRGVDLTLTAIEGPEYHFGNVYIKGNKLAKKHVILRELVIVQGDPYNFEKVFRSEQALIQLGFFNSAKIAPVNPELDSTDVDMMVTVEERKSGYITTDFGYNTFNGYNTAIEIGHRNLAGHGRLLSYRFEGNIKDPRFFLAQRASVVTFTWPWVARVPLDATFTVSDAVRQEIAYDDRAFTLNLGGSLVWKKLLNFLEGTHPNPQVREIAAHNHGFADPFTTRLNLEFAKDFIYNLSEAVVDQQQGEVILTTISPMLIHDLRDNVFNPTKWTYNTIRFDYGAPWLFSQVEYLKVTGQSAWYLPIFKALPFLPGWVFAQNFIAGHLQTLRPHDVVPISRRFFLGGSTTIRGFGQNQISPVGEDGKTPVGGYFMAYENTEFRIPLGVYDLGVLAFFDAGNVTGGTNNYDLDQVRTTSGFGLRYLSPIGPISGDFGFKLNKKSDESLYEFYITIGNAF
jgi:outer membrane protein insertion porin family